MTTSAAPLSAPSLDQGLADVLRAYRQMQFQHGRVVAHESERLGMGTTDIRALVFIAGDEDGATPKQVAEFLELSTGATTSLVDRLVNAGTVERQAHPTDRRSVILQVTEAGRDAVRHVGDVYRCALATAVPEQAYAETAAVFRGIALALTEGSACLSNEA